MLNPAADSPGAEKSIRTPPGAPSSPLQLHSSQNFMRPAGIAAAASFAAQLEAAALSQLGVRVAPHPTRSDTAAQTCVLAKADGSVVPIKASIRQLLLADAAAGSSGGVSSSRPSAVEPADALRLLQAAGMAPHALTTSLVVDPYGLDSSAPAVSVGVPPLLSAVMCGANPAASEAASSSSSGVVVRLRPEADPRVLQVCGMHGSASVARSCSTLLPPNFLLLSLRPTAPHTVLTSTPPSAPTPTRATAAVHCGRTQTHPVRDAPPLRSPRVLHCRPAPGTPLPPGDPLLVYQELAAHRATGPWGHPPPCWPRPPSHCMRPPLAQGSPAGRPSPLSHSSPLATAAVAQQQLSARATWPSACPRTTTTSRHGARASPRPTQRRLLWHSP